MKPIVLAPPPRPPIVPRGLIGDVRKLSPGEIDSDTVDPHEHSDWTQFIAHLRQCGWRLRACQNYAEHSYTYVNGSCIWHEDHGFGKVAACLIYRHANIGIDTQLITKHGGCPMGLGDLVVFDSNQGHAWIGHGPSVFAMVTVAPIRRAP